MANHCDKQQERMIQSLFGELPDAERRTLEMHLSECVHCRAEREAYVQTIDQLRLWGEEPIPRHFFVNAALRENPWRLFLHMQPFWRVVTGALAGLCILLVATSLLGAELGVDADGWILRIGRTSAPAHLRKELLNAVEEKESAASAMMLREIRNEIDQFHRDSTRRQQEHLNAVRAEVGRELRERIAESENRVGEEARRLASVAYHASSRQRAMDLNVINARFACMEAVEAVNRRQAGDIFGVLLEEAEWRKR